jgi:hypothetical protein
MQKGVDIRSMPAAKEDEVEVDDSGDAVELTQQVATAVESLCIPMAEVDQRDGLYFRVPDHAIPSEAKPNKRIRLWDRNRVPRSASSRSVSRVSLEVDGWIGKSRSPSCGVSDARIYMHTDTALRGLKAGATFIPNQDGVFTANLFHDVPTLSSRLLWVKQGKADNRAMEAAEVQFRRFLEKVVRRKIALKAFKA